LPIETVEQALGDLCHLRIEREYHLWSASPITVDTARKSVDWCVDELLLGVAGSALDSGG